MKIKILHIVFVVLLYGVQSQAAAQTKTFKAQIDSSNILIGEKAHVTFSVEIDKKDLYQWPVFFDTINKLEVVELGEIETKNSWFQHSVSQTIAVTSSDSGYYVIKPQLLILNGDSLYSDPLIVQVNTVNISENQEFYNIKQPVNPPFVWPAYLTWVIIALHVILLVWAFYILYKKKEETVENKIFDTRTPLEKLKDGLNSIKEEKLWEHKSDKQFYSVLTDLVRNYLEEGENIRALELTSYETKSEIQALNWNLTLKKNTLQLLEEADFIKFAKATATQEQKLVHIDHAILLLEHLENEALAQETNLKNDTNE